MVKGDLTKLPIELSVVERNELLKLELEDILRVIKKYGSFKDSMAIQETLAQVRG